MNNFRKISMDDTEFKCISLPKRKDRREWVESHLKNFNIPFEYFDGLTESNNYDNLKFLPGTKKGGIGGTLSHYEVIKNYNGDKILGIFEDDVLLCEDFIERFSYIENNFNLDWDIFFLSSFYHLNDDKNRWNTTGDFEFTGIKYIHRVYGSFCAHAYLVNPKSKEKILKLIRDNSHKSYAIDHLYILIQPELNCFSFTPGMSNQIVSHSDIDNDIKDQNLFEKIVGKHYFINKLSDFNYEEYFKLN
jgi:GR25 family glycosyltransferase involved in LPS biosynthesis